MQRLLTVADGRVLSSPRYERPEAILITRRKMTKLADDHVPAGVAADGIAIFIEESKGGTVLAPRHKALRPVSKSNQVEAVGCRGVGCRVPPDLALPLPGGSGVAAACLVVALHKNHGFLQPRQCGGVCSVFTTRRF